MAELGVVIFNALDFGLKVLLSFPILSFFDLILSDLIPSYLRSKKMLQDRGGSGWDVGLLLSCFELPFETLSSSTYIIKP